MKYIFLYLVLSGFCATKTFVAGNEELDVDRHDILWMNLFSKINAILNETTGLNERQNALEQKFNNLLETKSSLLNMAEYWKELKERQTNLEPSVMANFTKLAIRHNDLEERMKAHLKRMEERENALEQIVKSHLTKMENRENALNRTVAAYLANLTKCENTLEQKMNTHLTNLEKKQHETENALKHNFNHKWITILRRQDGSVDFSGDWEEYKRRFGHPDGEFFIGLERLHALTTKAAPQELLVILKDFEGEMRFARYDLFRIGNETEKYALKQLGTYSGNAGNGLVSHKGMKFSTFDNENYSYEGRTCAKHFKGGWWFERCFQSFLTGPYNFKNEKLYNGIMWLPWKSKLNSMKYAEMKIRPTVF